MYFQIYHYKNNLLYFEIYFALLNQLKFHSTFLYS